jgi:hypothetical protein
MSLLFKNAETTIANSTIHQPTNPAFASAFRALLFVVAICAPAAVVAGPPESKDAEFKYMGAATCASSNCHGGTSPRNSTNVLQNEFVTWQRHDRHSMAQAILENEDSKRIALLLGINNAATEPLCLKCHATFVENPALRGEKYRVEDGVSCESCHGAAEKWLQSHTEKDASHKRNIENGLKDILDVDTRTQMCLECHMGTDDQFVDHRLIGAGHPRLSFELDTYQMLEPAHWVVDDDYRSRKGDYINAQAWLGGQARLASELLAKATSPTRGQFGVMPELSTLYCYTCHHSLDEQQWKRREYGGRPGELRLNVAHLVIVREALRVANPSLGDELGNSIKLIHDGAGRNNIEQNLKSAKLLIDSKIVPAVKTVKFDPRTLRGLLRQIVQYGANTPHLPYEVAEQVAMGASALIASEDPEGKLFKVQIDDLYKSLGSPNSFKAEDFTTSATQLLAVINA